MPNYIHNVVMAPSHVIDGFMTDGEVDFNTVLPMPADVYRGDLGPDQERLYPGEGNWRDWSHIHWGTEWNASETGRPAPDMVVFDTAWTTPVPVLAALSRMCPGREVRTLYASDDLTFPGAILCMDGVVKEHATPGAFAPYGDDYTVLEELSRIVWGFEPTLDDAEWTEDWDSERRAEWGRSWDVFVRNHPRLDKSDMRSIFDVILSMGGEGDGGSVAIGADSPDCAIMDSAD